MTEITAERPEVLKCKGTADFLAAIPRLAGFTATNSMFVVFFAGSRASEAMRIDLPASDAPREVEPLLDFLVQTVRQLSRNLGAGIAPAVAIVTDRTFEECGGPPWLRLARRIERRLHRDRIALRELCVQAADGWTGLLDPIASKRPKPLSDIAGSGVAASTAPDGSQIRPLAELGRVPDGDPAIIAEVRTQIEKTPLSPATDNGMGTNTSASIVMASRLVRGELDPTPARIATVVGVLAHPMAWVFAAVALTDNDELASGLASIAATAPKHVLALSPQPQRFESPRPLPLAPDLLAVTALRFTDREQLQAWRATILDLLAVTPAGHRAGLFGLSAYVWWMCGNQTVAFEHLHRARDEAPDDEIVAMLEVLLGKPLASTKMGLPDYPE